MVNKTASRPRVPLAPTGGMKKGRKPPPEGETARDRFVRVGQPRVANAVHAIRLIGNLARGDYAWDERDLRTIVRALHEATASMEDEFKAVLGTKAPPKEPIAFDFEQGLQMPGKHR